MKITRIETIPFALPPRREHSWRGNSTPIGVYLLVRVHTDEGRVGVGEAPTLIDWGGPGGRYYGESPTTAAHVIGDYLEPALTGLDPGNVHEVHLAMDRVVAGHPYAKASIDVACFDLAGQEAGVPVASLLHNANRAEVPLAHSFGIAMSPYAVRAEAEVVLREGIRCFKLKVGRDLERDVAAMRELRAIAEDTTIFVDANMAWRDAAAAGEAIRRLDEYGVAWVEQPSEYPETLAEIRRVVRPPIMADESAWTARDVRELADARAVDYVSIYYSKPGGLRPAMDVDVACVERGLRANVNGSAESGIGSAANVHLAAAAQAAALPSLIMASAPSGREPTREAARLYADDLIEQPLDYHDGRLVVPREPGLGVHIDEVKLAKYRVDR